MEQQHRAQKRGWLPLLLEACVGLRGALESTEAERSAYRR